MRRASGIPNASSFIANEGNTSAEGLLSMRHCATRSPAERSIMILESLESIHELNYKVGLFCPETVEVDYEPCERCEGTGFVEVDVDYFGRKQTWVRCNACENGMVEVEDAA